MHACHSCSFACMLRSMPDTRPTMRAKVKTPNVHSQVKHAPSLKALREYYAWHRAHGHRRQGLEWPTQHGREFWAHIVQHWANNDGPKVQSKDANRPQHCQLALLPSAVCVQTISSDVCTAHKMSVPYASHTTADVPWMLAVAYLQAEEAGHANNY